MSEHIVFTQVPLELCDLVCYRYTCTDQDPLTTPTTISRKLVLGFPGLLLASPDIDLSMFDIRKKCVLVVS